jgi:hypothetical protein
VGVLQYQRFKILRGTLLDISGLNCLNHELLVQLDFVWIKREFFAVVPVLYVICPGEQNSR